MKKQKRSLQFHFVCIVLVIVGVFMMMMCVYPDSNEGIAGRWGEARFGEAVYGQ